MSTGTIHPAEVAAGLAANQSVGQPTGRLGPGEPQVEWRAHPVLAGLEDAGTALESARQADAWAASDDDLATALAECEALAARVAELELTLVREADDRDLGRRLGASSTAAWLRHRFRLRPGDAKARVSMAHRLRDTTNEDAAADWSANVTGPAVRGAMPATGAALRTGAVSTEHARVISTVLSRIPTDIDNEIVAERSEEHTSELQSRGHLVCRLLLEKKKPKAN